MAYYFAVETEDRYLVKHIKESGFFDRNHKYNQEDACTLEEIDAYTSRYPNERFMKSCLLSEKILKEEDLEQALAIIYIEGFLDKAGAIGKKVEGSLIYKDSKYLLENPIEVIKYIDNKSKENDFTFFRNLSEDLPNDSIAKSLISKIASLLETSAINDSRKLELDTVNQLGHNIVIETAKLLIYNNHINSKGEITSTNELNYEKFHKIVSFISNYEISLNKSKDSTQVKIKAKENTSN